MSSLFAAGNRKRVNAGIFVSWKLLFNVVRLLRLVCCTGGPREQ